MPPSPPNVMASAGHLSKDSLMLAEEVEELVDFDLDEVPVCGTVISGWTWKTAQVTDCPNEAVWLLTTNCCETKSAARCDEHKRKCVLVGMVCGACERYPVEQTW